jgi:hypothetical protein
MACALDVAVEPSRVAVDGEPQCQSRATTDRDRLRRLKMYRRVPRAANARDGDSSLPLGDEPPSAALAAGNTKTLHSDFDLRSDEITR